MCFTEASACMGRFRETRTAPMVARMAVALIEPPPREPGVVGVVRAGRLVGVHGALVQRPAQRRRVLPGQGRPALVFAVGVVDGDVQPGVANRQPPGPRVWAIPRSRPRPAPITAM